MTMREKIARAIGGSRQDEPHGDYGLRMRLSWDEQLRAADAVLNAMREPTEAMVEAYQLTCMFPSDEAEREHAENLKEAWSTMVNAALSEGMAGNEEG